MTDSICPYCAWAACGLLLSLCVPELLAQSTPLGPAPLWLFAIPLASALLRRQIRPARV